jgi:hypothetical protein
VLMLSADRFAQGETTIPLGPNDRRQLLDRFGLYGVRLAVALLRQREITTASQLAGELVGRSGIDRLRNVLLSQFSERRDTLKARSALNAVSRLLTMHPVAGAPELGARLEQIRSGAHEFAELRLLNALRMGEVDVRAEEEAELERLLGVSGTGITSRLGLDPDAGPETMRKALLTSLTRWRQRAENPVSSLATVTASRVVIRTCEGLYAALGA